MQKITINIREANELYKLLDDCYDLLIDDEGRGVFDGIETFQSILGDRVAKCNGTDIIFKE